MEKPSKNGSGSWSSLASAEEQAQRVVSAQLKAFEEPFQLTHDSGEIVPRLRNKNLSDVDVRISAMFLKRVLNDLRSVRVLLFSGYTSQAAAVAASLFENALASICLTRPENIEVLRRSSSGEVPWSPMQMTKMVI